MCFTMWSLQCELRTTVSSNPAAAHWARNVSSSLWPTLVPGRRTIRHNMQLLRIAMRKCTFRIRYSYIPHSFSTLNLCHETNWVPHTYFRNSFWCICVFEYLYLCICSSFYHSALNCISCGAKSLEAARRGRRKKAAAEFGQRKCGAYIWYMYLVYVYIYLYSVMYMLVLIKVCSIYSL